MSPELPDIHIHLTAQAGTTVQITFADGNVVLTSDNAETNTGILDGATAPQHALEAAIRRLQKSGRSPNVREAAEGLLAMGYELLPAETRVQGGLPENYLRIVDPAYAASGIGYLTPSLFSFSRGADRERLLDLPDAQERVSAVAFSHVNSAQPGLDVARMLKG